MVFLGNNIYITKKEWCTLSFLLEIGKTTELFIWVHMSSNFVCSAWLLPRPLGAAGQVPLCYTVCLLFLGARLKATLCNNLTLFVVWFYRQLVLVPSSSFILIAYGRVRDRQTPVSFPLAIQEMHYAVLCSKLEHPAKMEEKLSQHHIASYTAKRHQLVCWQASISANCWWCLQGFCMPFR